MSENNYYRTTAHRPKYVGTNVNYRVEYDYNRVALVFVFGLIIIALGILISFYFGFDTIQNLIMICVLVAVFAVIATYVMETRKIEEIEKRFIKEIEKEVEVPIIKVRDFVHTIDNPIIKVVEKTVPIFRDVERKVYVQKPRKKLDIPKYEYVGSNETMIYHFRKCRISKSIKRSNLVSNNSREYFLKHKYKACKLCNPGKK